LRGPPPTPTNLRILRGNPSKRPLPKNEPKPTRPEQCPEPPDALEAYAADEWRLVAGELWRLGLYTVCDKGALCAYCYSYGQWRTAAEIIKGLAANDSAMHGLLVKREGAAVQNPLVGIARRAAADMVRYASEFGFTPAARARIAAGVDNQEPSKFGSLLAG
jgi:P27 family predicted phage terminase small subunit